MSRKLLVTGGAGFIGCNFVRTALEHGDQVVVLDLLTYAGHRANLEGVQRDIDFVEGNIGDQSLVASLLEQHRPQAVMNFAAESHVDRSIDGPAAFIDTNIRGCFNLLDCSLKYWRKLESDAQESFRFIQVSTDEVYGQLGKTGAFSEKTPYAPNSPYSASKASADFLVRAWHHTYGLPTLTTNCSNNYGPYQFPEKLIPVIITRALKGEGLPVYGDGSNIRDWIHVEDHCRGLLLALEKGRPGETYCFGGAAETNNLDVVKSICAHLDVLKPGSQKYEKQIQFVEDRLGHDWRYAVDDTRAQQELGFTRQHDFESGLRATVEWYLDHQSWCETVLKEKR